MTLRASETVSNDAAIVSLLQYHTYADVQKMTGLSKGAIYRLALKSGARKTETRIAQRRADRQREQEAFLREMLNTTAKADVPVSYTHLTLPTN
jgi:site-specific DNA-methyltransferase (adenine-specific)